MSACHRLKLVSTNSIYLAILQFGVVEGMSNLWFIYIHVIVMRQREASFNVYLLSFWCFLTHWILAALYDKVFGHLTITSIFAFWTSCSRFSPPYAVIIAFTLLGKLSTRYWSMAVCICPFSHKTIGEFSFWCQVRRSVAQSAHTHCHVMADYVIDLTLCTGALSC